MITAEDVKKALERYDAGTTANTAVRTYTADDVRAALRPYGEIPVEWHDYTRTAYKQAAQEQAQTASGGVFTPVRDSDAYAALLKQRPQTQTQTAQSGGASGAPASLQPEPVVVRDSDAYAALLKRRQDGRTQAQSQTAPFIGPTPAEGTGYFDYARFDPDTQWITAPAPLSIPYYTEQEIPFNSLQLRQTADTMGNTGTAPAKTLAASSLTPKDMPYKEAADYLRKSLSQTVLGNYTDDVTLLGTAAQIALGLAGADLPMDIRDLTYDLTHWKSTPGHVAQTLLDAVGLLPLVGIVKNVDEVGALAKSAIKNSDDAAAGIKAVIGNSDEAATVFKDAAKKMDEAGETVSGFAKRADDAIEGAEDFIDGIKITNGKVGGKIPIDEFKTIRQSSIKNPDADSMTLGKFTDDATSYTQRAGTNSSYFDLGNEWGSIKQRYGLNNNEMFDYFNKSALDNAISKGKTIRFSHNPLDYGGSFLTDEWEYLKETLNLTDANLVYDGGFWYVR